MSQAGAKQALEIALQRHLPNKLCYAVCSVSDSASLLSEEIQQIEQASSSRQQEFAAGRYAARQALSQLGVTNVPVLKAESGEPQWPQNVVGSISHSGDLAVAVVSKADDYSAIGIDLQGFRKPHPRLFERVCTPEEQALDWYSDSDVAVLQLFSVKESVYKAVFPRQREHLGFHDVLVRFDDDNRFTAHIKNQQVIKGHSLVLSHRSIFSLALA